MANFDLSKLMEGKNPQAVMLAETRQLKTKWEKTGLLEGMKEREQHSMALPLVRRIFGEIAAKEFVSVQPMNLPSGLIFFLDFKYGSAQGGNPAYSGKSLFGGNGTSAANSDFGRTKAAVNGLYGNGRYGYTVNNTGSVVASCTVASGSTAGIGFDSAVSASATNITTASLKTVAVPVASLLNADVEAVKSFTLSGTGITEVYNAFTAYDGTNVIFYVKHGGGATVSATVDFSVQPLDYNRGDFEDQSANGTNITATPELAQDLNAYHSIDAEAELTSMLSDYISLEIDLEILDMLKANALTTEYWSATIGEEYNGSTWAAGTNTLAYQKNTWYQTLGVKLNKVSNKIHQLTLRGGANFIVASPDVCTILESIPGFVVNADKDAMQFAAGVTAVGSMSNRYTVYKNPYMTSNEILMGYRGNNFLETGAVYAPYVPLIMTPLVYDPQNFTPRRGVMTRYAKKMVRPEYYGKIYVKDLASI